MIGGLQSEPLEAAFLEKGYLNPDRTLADWHLLLTEGAGKWVQVKQRENSNKQKIIEDAIRTANEEKDNPEVPQPPIATVNGNPSTQKHKPSPAVKKISKIWWAIIPLFALLCIGTWYLWPNLVGSPGTAIKGRFPLERQQMMGEFANQVAILKFAKTGTGDSDYTYQISGINSDFATPRTAKVNWEKYEIDFEKLGTAKLMILPNTVVIKSDASEYNFKFSLPKSSKIR